MLTSIKASPEFLFMGVALRAVLLRCARTSNKKGIKECRNRAKPGVCYVDQGRGRIRAASAHARVVLEVLYVPTAQLQFAHSSENRGMGTFAPRSSVYCKAGQLVPAVDDGCW